MVYHLSWMFRDLGHNVLAVDLDPQSNLTSIFLEEADVERLWPDGPHNETILGSVAPLIESLGDIQPANPIRIDTRLHIIAGDLGLSTFEDRLSAAWGNCLSDNPATAGDGFRVVTAFHRVMKSAVEKCGSKIVLIDVGPNIGAMNRAALVAADYVVIPLGADLFSLQGLRNLGPTLRGWQGGWITRQSGKIPLGLSMPSGLMQPLGYVLLNPSVRENRPVKSYLKWANRIPGVYAEDVLGLKEFTFYASADDDPHQLAMLKHFKSLMPMAQDARKPMFHLTAADGAIGGHSSAVQDCKRQFQQLALRILALSSPQS
jgi:cellulose biosynthesis protein BcsQ